MFNCIYYTKKIKYKNNIQKKSELMLPELFYFWRPNKKKSRLKKDTVITKPISITYTISLMILPLAVCQISPYRL